MSSTEGIPGRTVEAGLVICEQLEIDPKRVLSINIFVLNSILVVRTLDGDIHCHLVPGVDTNNEVVFHIVKDGRE